MTKKPISDSIVFFGTSQVSLGSLQALAEKFAVEAVITKPDAKLRGKTQPPVIKSWSKQRKIPLFQIPNAVELEKLFTKTQQFKSQLGVVIDYGLLIPDRVINSFELGMVNSHFSLLPQWRGADPIRAAIISGQRTTGISLILIDSELDHGPLLAQAEQPITTSDTADSLRDKLVTLNNRLLLRTLPQYLRGEITPQPQDPEHLPTYTRKLTKTDGLIDWSKPADYLARQIRAYQGWPGAQATLAGKLVQMTQARVVSEYGTPGQIFVKKRQLGVYAGREALVIERLKPAGKREMSGSAFLAGLRNLQQHRQ